MTTSSSSQATSISTSAENPPSGGVGGIFTGPAGAHLSVQATLPTGKLCGFGLIGAAFAGGVVTGVVTAMGMQAGLVSGLVGLGAGVIPSVGMALATRPWKPRGIQLWPFTLLAAQAGSCLLVIGLVLLLYFSAPRGALSPVVLVIAAGASFVGSWTGMVCVVGPRLNVAVRQQKPLDSPVESSDQ